MKRFALFAGMDYYPAGGMEDFVCDSDDVEALKKLISFSPPVSDLNFVYIKIDHPNWDNGNREVDSPSDQWLSIWDMIEMKEVYKDSTRNHKSA